MITYGVIGAITISAGLIEKRFREEGNVTGALAAKRFGTFFLLGSGSWITWTWVTGMLMLFQ